MKDSQEMTLSEMSLNNTGIIEIRANNTKWWQQLAEQTSESELLATINRS